MKHFCWLECQWLNKSFINGTPDGLRILWYQPSIPVSIVNNTTCGRPSDGGSKPIKLNGEVKRRERKRKSVTKSNRHTRIESTCKWEQGTLFVDLVSMSMRLSTMLPPHCQWFTILLPNWPFCSNITNRLDRCIPTINHDSMVCKPMANIVQLIQQVLADAQRYDSMTFNLVWTADNN